MKRFVNAAAETDIFLETWQDTMSQTTTENQTTQHSTEQAWKVAVVGGGISGLAAAHRLIELSQEQGRQLSLTLFEASGRLGGVIGTEQVEGYTVERGPDAFISTKPAALKLCQRMGLEDQLIGTDPRFRQSMVLRKGRPVPVPEGFMLMVPVKTTTALLSPVFSPWGKIRMGMEYIIPKKKVPGDETLAAFVRRRLGQEALDRLVQPLMSGIYTSDPEKLSLQATLPRFLEMEQRDGSLIRSMRKEAKARAKKQPKGEKQDSGARYSMFLSMREGMAQLPLALQERIEAAATIRCETPLRSVSRNEGEGFLLEFGDGQSEQFDAVVLAVPAFRVAEALRGFDGELAGVLGEIAYASSAIVISGYRLEDVKHPLDCSGLVIPKIENRGILSVSCTSRKFPYRAPEGRVQLRTFLGGDLMPEQLDQTDDEMVETVRRELREIFGVTGEPDFVRVCRYDRAMPQFHLGHIERLTKIEAAMQKHPALALAGNGYYGIGIPDCVQSGEQAAEKVFEQAAKTVA